MTTPLGAGAAAFGAGEGYAGHDPDDNPSARVDQPAVAAITFDPFQRVYVQESNLTMRASSGPIHRAAHLILPLGALPSTATSGLDIVAIRRAAPSQRQKVVEDAMRRALKPLIDAGELALDRVTLAPGEPWSGRWYADVRDLVTGQLTKLSSKA